MPPYQRIRWWRLPAFQALAIQGVALPLSLIVFTIAGVLGLDLSVTSLLILQGIVAAVISYWRQLPAWWIYIQFFFPIALGVVAAFHLPPGFFLTGFLFLVALFWTTFHTRVPFYPSSRAVWRSVAGLLPENRAIKMLDVGSGFGGLLRYLAGRRPDSQFVGIEVAPLPWLASRLRQTAGPVNCRFVRGDYNRVNFADYDVLFAYLSSAAMPALWEKAYSEMRRGSLLLSYEFPAPDFPAHLLLLPEPNGPCLYGWYM